MHHPRRSPDTSRVKAKMMYASTKDFFKSYLEGLAVELQVIYNDHSVSSSAYAVKGLVVASTSALSDAPTSCPTALCSSMAVADAR